LWVWLWFYFFLCRGGGAVNQSALIIADGAFGLVLLAGRQLSHRHG
jgi:hypothetical protein